MLHHALFWLAVASAATASPLIPREVQIDGLTEDTVLVLNNGTTSIMKKADYLDKLKAEGVLLSPPPIDYSYLNFTPPAEKPAWKRQSCSHTTAIVVDRTEVFNDWDVQMSPVVCASTGTFMINVMQGFQVSNTVQVSAGLNPTVIKDKLGATFGVNFSRQWTTQTSVTTNGPVPQGMCGAMVNNPRTTRRYGRVLQGCPGSFTQTGTFMADDRGTGSYAGITWCSGFITVCAKTQSQGPLSRCNGQGFFN